MLVVCDRWVGDGDRPQVLLTLAAPLSHSGWDAQPWVTESRKSSVCKLILPLASCPQLTPTATGTELTQAVCGTWLYNCLTPTWFLWAYASAPNSTMSTGQGDIPISWTGCTCFAVLLLICTGASLDWRLGRGSICYNNFIHLFDLNLYDNDIFLLYFLTTRFFLLVCNHL